MRNMTTAWVLDSGGAGRGAWQGGVIYEFLQWSRASGRYPQISMGASAGGYAAADVATGTEATVMKGWTAWGKGELLVRHPPPEALRLRTHSRFRLHLHASLDYVMAPAEVAAVFDADAPRKLAIFVTRIRRRDGRALGRNDLVRLFLKSATRKLPRSLKYLPAAYVEDPIVFATSLPPELCSEYVRPLTRANYHRVIEASCLVPLAMGPPIAPHELRDGSPSDYPGDAAAVFVDGGYSLKMPMARFEEDECFAALRGWAAADKTVVFCCDPSGLLWETSSRLRVLNSHPAVARALAEDRMLVIYPDHKVEAGFLCLDNRTIMRTFERGREQGRRLLRTPEVTRFFEFR